MWNLHGGLFTALIFILIETLCPPVLLQGALLLAVLPAAPPVVVVVVRGVELAHRHEQQFAELDVWSTLG